MFDRFLPLPQASDQRFSLLWLWKLPLLRLQGPACMPEMPAITAEISIMSQLP